LFFSAPQLKRDPLGAIQMSIEPNQISWSGPSLDDVEILPRLPAPYTRLLSNRNGFIAFDGGLHMRGACLEPPWHSIRAVLEGPDAIHLLFSEIRPDDIPFGQDALGDQFVLREGIVHRLDAEAGDLASSELDFNGFLAAAAADPVAFLALQPLLNFHELGGTLAPGQLLSAYPPFVFKESGGQSDLRAIPAVERLRFLSQLARNVRDAPDGTRIQFKVK
jgi:hypothetical protein